MTDTFVIFNLSTGLFALLRRGCCGWKPQQCWKRCACRRVTHVGNLDPLNTWVVVVVVVVANMIVDIVMLRVMNTFILPDVVMFRVLNTIDELCLC